MLVLKVVEAESFNEKTNEFVVASQQTLRFEHSLVSLSKWESKYEKAFLGKDEKTTEETLGYLECMCLDEGVDPETFSRLSQADVDKISDYIQASMTASWITELNPKKSQPGETVTSELIYYWMVALNIPFEAETWHLNRLFTLIRIANIKNEKPKKMSPREMAERNRSLNEQRKKQLGTTG